MANPIGDRLAAVRELSGLSAAALGEKAGLSRAIVSMIESGERKNPNSKTISALAHVLGVSVGWLIDGVGPEPTKKAVQAAVAKGNAA
jgi:transcriptional regulator with XRE-family HTH domain